MHIYNESQEAKANFLARMSHEMRTPLNAIIGMSTIAQTTNDPEKKTNCLTKINEAAVHLLGMINDILDLAKIEAGNFKLSKAELNLSQLIQKRIEMLKFNLDAKKQNIELDLDDTLPEIIFSDEQRLSQVLDNLLSNAVKFTPAEGNIKLSVKKLKEEGNSCTLEITVKDTGIGISGEELNKIFALFEQCDGGMNRKHCGAGIGLAISSNIVRLMGGEIRVNSELRKGSSFSFDITVEQGLEKNTSYFCHEEAIEQKAKFAGKTIILAEDVEINREIVISLLEDSGVAIDCAENGRQALEKYISSPENYDLILMDIHMPEMDGFEATQQIRAYEAECNAKEIPIVAMTANIFKDDVKKCLDFGMTCHMGKPVDHDELMKQLDMYLVRS